MPNYCPVEYIGELNGVHHYYAQELTDNPNPPPPKLCGSLVVLLLEQPYVGPLACPCDHPVAASLARKDDQYKKARKLQPFNTPPPAPLVVVCSNTLAKLGMDDFIHPKKGVHHGDSLTRRGQFRFKNPATHSCNSDNKANWGIGALRRNYRLLKVTGQYPAGTPQVYYVGFEERMRRQKDQSHFRKIVVGSDDYYALDAGVK